MKLGLIIGRFQPLHNGHMSLINKAREENDEVLILMGSANRISNFKNPWSPEERVSWIQDALGNTDGVHIKPLKDFPDNDTWVQEVTAYATNIEEDPSNITLYTSSKDEEYYRNNFIFHIDTVNTEDISATLIRNHMYTSGTLEPFEAPSELEREALKLWLDSKEYTRLLKEMTTCNDGAREAKRNHAFSNPIEPVVHAAVIQDNKILLVKRNSPRGMGQWALPGGFLECNESTREGSLRELKEETGLDLLQYKAKEMAQCVEENLDDLSVRTLGINFLYVVAPDEELEINIDHNEVLEYRWERLANVADESFLLFYNHNLVVQRLLSEVAKHG